MRSQDHEMWEAPQKAAGRRGNVYIGQVVIGRGEVIGS